ncbi:MAG: glycosyltransferase family 4 protein [Acidobacteriota bacterium]
MRVVLVNYGGDFAADAEPEAVLDELRSVEDWAGALRKAGADVVVVQGFHREARCQRAGIDYRFVAGRFSPRLSRKRIPWRLHRVVRRLAPDVVHLNGLLYGLQARALGRSLPRATRLVLQHHGERPDEGLAAHVQRWGLRAADGFFFTSPEMAEPWRARGLIPESRPVFGIMEGSSRFLRMERSAARESTGLTGDPIYLWAANLDANKDPMTVLDGFERSLAELPAARLYLTWRLGNLRPQVEQRIAASAQLRNAVQLLGPKPYAEMEPLYNSADFLLQGSHREGSGYAVADALACGTIPVVTDIASFRFMTAQGVVGALWPPGDATALHQAILRLAAQPRPAQRQAARNLFERHLSLPVIGRQAVDAYRQLGLERKIHQPESGARTGQG